MAKHTFTVVFENDNQQHEMDFNIDVGDWTEEDFQGGDGEEYLESLVLDLFPEATVCWIECPETLEA